MDVHAALHPWQEREIQPSHCRRRTTGHFSANPRLQIKSLLVRPTASKLYHQLLWDSQHPSFLQLRSPTLHLPLPGLLIILIIPRPHTSFYCSLTFLLPVPQFTLPQSTILGPSSQQTPPPQPCSLPGRAWLSPSLPLLQPAFRLFSAPAFCSAFKGRASEECCGSRRFVQALGLFH